MQTGVKNEQYNVQFFNKTLKLTPHPTQKKQCNYFSKALGIFCNQFSLNPNIVSFTQNCAQLTADVEKLTNPTELQPPKNWEKISSQKKTTLLESSSSMMKIIKQESFT